LLIDLRSDTVTRPTPEMLEAMAKAEVGDDVYREDPTVRRLEEEGAELVGKEEALFLPSGTMGNQVAIMTHTSRGDEIIADADSHVAGFEVGAASMLAGVQVRTVESLLEGDTAARFSRRVRPENIHFPPVRLLCLENTFNQGGGTILSPGKMKEAFEAAKQEEIAVHLDGARICNAAVGMDRDVKEFTRWSDSVMFCLSKGLCAPVGSLLAGEASFIDRARKYRKALGGGMRQAGVLAAAGLEALKMRKRLHEDHQNARVLAENLASLEGIRIDLDRVQTNMVQLHLEGGGAAELVEEMKAGGVLANSLGQSSIRLVTHKDVSRKEVERAVDMIKEAIKEMF